MSGPCFCSQDDVRTVHRHSIGVISRSLTLHSQWIDFLHLKVGHYADTSTSCENFTSRRRNLLIEFGVRNFRQRYSSRLLSQWEPAELMPKSWCRRYSNCIKEILCSMDLLTNQHTTSATSSKKLLVWLRSDKYDKRTTTTEDIWSQKVLSRVGEFD